MKQHLALLGHRVRDAVTGFEGVVESISFDLYGCVQAIVRPEQDKKKPGGEMQSSHWFDTKRLTVKSKTPVMAVPTFEPAAAVPGGIEKPPYPSKPAK